MTVRRTVALEDRGVFDVTEASAYLHVNGHEVSRMLKASELVGWRVGAKASEWRISRAACDRYIEARDAAAADPEVAEAIEEALVASAVRRRLGQGEGIEDAEYSALVAEGFRQERQRARRRRAY